MSFLRIDTAIQQWWLNTGFITFGWIQFLVFGVLVVAAISDFSEASYASTKIPSWDELDARPMPNWYNDAKFGIFIHWGIFSVPSFGSEWFWNHWQNTYNYRPHDNHRNQPEQEQHYQNNINEYRFFVNRTERPGFTYQEYASRFTAELYRPEYWAQIFAQSGAQYVVLTSKHHEGYCNWDSRNVPTTWNWNVMDIGPKRDLLGDLAKQIRNRSSPQTKQRLKFGIYHSLYEWYNPLYLYDKANNFTTQHFVDTKSLPELYDLVEKYAPEIVWSDGHWEGSSDYWKAREFLHWYSTNSSVRNTAVWNDRWGQETICKHGTFLTCSDRYNPGKLQTRKWENALTIDANSWGLNRNATIGDYMTVQELIHTMIEVVAFNGNFLLNVGPGADGTINPVFMDRLLGIGEWLDVNGEAIYGTVPWHVIQNETNSSVFYTKKEDTLYALFTEWPSENVLHLAYPVPTANTRVHFLGLLNETIAEVEWEPSPYAVVGVTDRKIMTQPMPPGLRLHIPALTPNLIPCQHAWVIAIHGLANL